MKKFIRIFLWIVLGLSGACLLLAALSAWANRDLAQTPPGEPVLTASDRAHLIEFNRLRQSVGQAVWPGWGQANIPVILYNQSYVFLVGFPQEQSPASGWVQVPAAIQRGQPWQALPGEELAGAPVYRQPVADPNETPQAFTVRVGEQWTASLTTFGWMKTKLAQDIRADLPEFLRPIFPYRLFIGQLIESDDQFISLIAHEAFHAFQGATAPEKFALAEGRGRELSAGYPCAEPAASAAWQEELTTLAQALRAEGPESRAQAQRFIELRAARRAGLSAEGVAYEQYREWVEGLARYAELEIWRQAAQSTAAPAAETAALDDFHAFAGFEGRWSRELGQMPRAAAECGDTRFYYSGMAQAVLLDRFSPGWKTSAFQPDIWLDELLAQAVQP